MIFFAITPLMIGAFGNFCIPLMIGARDMAFPLLNMISFWTFLLSQALVIASFFMQMGSAGAGWTTCPPLSTNIGTPGMGQTLVVLAIFVTGVATIMGSINYVTTVIRLRAPGMTYMRMPATVWGLWLTAILNVLFVPVLGSAALLLLFDRAFGTQFFIAGAAAVKGGGDPLLWQHLFWIFGHPEVYILILPALGIVSEVLPTFARKPLFGAPVVIYSGVLIGFFGFGVWSHHMFAAGMGPIADAAFAVATMLIAIPTGIKIFNWLATLWGGALRLTTAMHFAVGLIGLFTLGGLSGIMHASPPVDLQQTDTYFVVAHFHYVLIGGSLFGLFAGTYYWWPKLTGRLLDERLGKLHFWVLCVGFNVAFFPQHYLGAVGMPRRIYTYPAGAGWGFWNLVSTVGAFGIALGVLLFMVNAWRSLRAGAPAPADPWDGRTLEWRTSSPPPVHDFDTVPPVHGRDTFWREKYGPRRAAPPAPAPDHVHLPPPSHWPVIVGLGIGALAVGALTHLAVVLAGAALTVFGIFRFALEHHRTPEHAHQTGALDVDHRKLAMWVFLGSECFFFGTLIATYLAYKGRSVEGPGPHQILNLPLTTLSTFDLLMSSLLMVLALAAVQRGDRSQARLWLFGTALFGLVFLGFQVYEFTHFVREGLTLQRNLFGSTFFVLTGLHGAHVTVGVIWLLALGILDLRGRLGVADAVKVEVAGLYWHFVDVVWIAIFTLVYLIP
jgi:cytochrome c oxidase subunit 1